MFGVNRFDPMTLAGVAGLLAPWRWLPVIVRRARPPLSIR